MNRTQRVILVLFTLVLGLQGCGDSPSKDDSDTDRPVFVQPLSVSGGIEKKAFNGVIQSAVSADISFRIPGTVEKVSVVVGQSVNSGDELARLDPHDYEVVVIELEAKLEEVRAASTFYQAEYDRIKQASRNQAVAPVNLERAFSNLAQSKASLKVVEQNLIKARDALSYTLLKAPFDGIVGEVKIENFEQVLPAVPVIEVHKPNALEAVVDVPENQLPRFTKGLDADIEWYGSTTKHKATVSEIATVAHPVKQTYDVTFSFRKPTGALLPGKSVTVNVSLNTGQEKEFCVPFSAVLQTGAEAYVFLASESDQKVSIKSVNVARIAEDNLCITGELSPDQLVVTAGVHFLKDGQTVGKFLENE